MNLLLAALYCVNLGAVFEVQSFPLAGKDSLVFAAHADKDATADVFVLEGSTLTAYPSAAGHTARPIFLPAGTSAFDVADIDADGQPDIIAICGERILLCAIPVTGPTAGPRELFRLDTQFADESGGPFPWVLVIRRDDQPLLALPCANTLELRTPDGKPIASYPAGPDAPRRVSYGSPFRSWSSDAPTRGPSAALQARVGRVLDYEPQLPDDILPAHKRPPEYRWVPPSEIRDAAGDKYHWRWFPLSAKDEGSRRVVYASTGSGSGETTLVRLLDAAENSEWQDKSKLGPARRYPGWPLVEEKSAPDFNGDGYVDLLLWTTPKPGLSVEALTRLIVGETWPLRLTVHLFTKEKDCYESRPRALIECRVPAGWFMAESPVRSCVFHDFDGDGKSDIAFQAGEKEYAVWLYRDGFKREPDQTVTLPEAISGVEFRADFDRKGRTSLGLRTEHALYLLYAKP